MSLGRVRSVDERVADPQWCHGQRFALVLTVATLGSFTFVWFTVHALRQFHTSTRDRDEMWAAVWGVVAVVSWWLGGGLAFATTEESLVSLLVWAVRLGSLLHVHADHRSRLRARAAAEVEREHSLIGSGLGAAGLRPGGTPVLGMPGTIAAGPVPPRPVSAGPPGDGRFGAPSADPFAVGRPPAAPPRAPVAAPRAGRGRTWGALSKGAPELQAGRRLESPAPPPVPAAPWAPPDAAGAPAPAAEAPTWIPGLEPLSPADAPRLGRPGQGGSGAPAAPPSGRKLDL